jgi:hypothetical protein
VETETSHRRAFRNKLWVLVNNLPARALPSAVLRCLVHHRHLRQRMRDIVGDYVRAVGYIAGALPRRRELSVHRTLPWRDLRERLVDDSRS